MKASRFAIRSSSRQQGHAAASGTSQPRGVSPVGSSEGVQHVIAIDDIGDPESSERRPDRRSSRSRRAWRFTACSRARTASGRLTSGRPGRSGTSGRSLTASPATSSATSTSRLRTHRRSGCPTRVRQWSDGAQCPSRGLTFRVASGSGALTLRGEHGLNELEKEQQPHGFDHMREPVCRGLQQP
jgi:hypothetical protein